MKGPPLIGYAVIALIALSSALPKVAAAAVFLGPAPYLSFGDSPFSALSFNYLHLEDLEDNSVNSTGLSASGGFVTTGADVNRDSIDADDGVIDGSGSSGFGYVAVSNVGATVILTSTPESSGPSRRMRASSGLMGEAIFRAHPRVLHSRRLMR